MLFAVNKYFWRNVMQFFGSRESEESKAYCGKGNKIATEILSVGRRIVNFVLAIVSHRKIDY